MSTPAFPISPDLGQLLALRRVRRGHVVLVGHDLIIDHERRVPDYIHAHLHGLLDDGHLYLGDERTEWAQRPVLATASGEQLHTKLEELRAPGARPRPGLTRTELSGWGRTVLAWTTPGTAP